MTLSLRFPWWPALGALFFAGLFAAVAQSPTNIAAGKKPAMVCIVLAQPKEDPTVAFRENTALWDQPAYPGYGFGAWAWPGGALNLVLKNPTREDLKVSANLVEGQCHLLAVDSKPNPDAKKSAQFPEITTAEFLNLKVGHPGEKNFTHGVSFLREPLELVVNGKKTVLKYGEPVLFPGERVIVEYRGQILTSSEPPDPCVIVLSFFKDSKGMVYPVKSRFF